MKDDDKFPGYGYGHGHGNGGGFGNGFSNGVYLLSREGRPPFSFLYSISVSGDGGDYNGDGRGGGQGSDNSDNRIEHFALKSHDGI